MNIYTAMYRLGDARDAMVGASWAFDDQAEQKNRVERAKEFLRDAADEMGFYLVPKGAPEQP